MNFTPTCRGWIELPAADIISEDVSIPFCTKPTRQTLKFLLPKRLTSQTSKARISYRFGMFKAVIQAAQSDYYETHLLHVCINLVHAFAIKATQQHGSHHHRGILAGGSYLSPLFGSSLHYQLPQAPSLVELRRISQTIQEACAFLERMTSTGRSRHIGSSRSVW